MSEIIDSETGEVVSAPVSEDKEGKMTDITTQKVSPQLAELGWTYDQLLLVKNTVCPPGITNDEFRLFAYVAKKAGLDPLQKQIHCAKRSGKLVIMAGIDGLQARAAREADYEGIIHGVVCEKDEFVYDAAAGKVTTHQYNAFADRGQCLGAWATVQRAGKLPFTALVKFAEFNQPATPTWKQMPTVMIDKVARSTALRMAFPEQFSSIYEHAEMDQASPFRKDQKEQKTLNERLTQNAAPAEA
jgi:phage recombination protein Bet